MTRFLLLICVLFLLACDRESQDEIGVIEKRSSIDMTDWDVNRRWYESKFYTPYEKLESINGSCISWGGSGQCWYGFEVLEGVQVKSKDEYSVIDCDDVYESFVKEFKNDKDLGNLTNLMCRMSCVQVILVTGWL